MLCAYSSHRTCRFFLHWKDIALDFLKTTLFILVCGQPVWKCSLQAGGDFPHFGENGIFFRGAPSNKEISLTEVEPSAVTSLLFKDIFASVSFQNGLCYTYLNQSRNWCHIYLFFIASVSPIRKFFRNFLPWLSSGVEFSF